MAAADPDPLARLNAILAADFDEAACGPQVLPLWFAFWGELHFQGTYDEVAEVFDARRKAATSALWRELLPGIPEEEADQNAEWVETLTDGYWQRLHLSPASFDRRTARIAAQRALTLFLRDAERVR
jgi:TetR/AcrR family transcriptional repressor of bet genes